MPHRTETALGERTQPGQKGGTAYRDPFDPIYWQVTPRAPTETEPPKVRRDVGQAPKTTPRCRVTARGRRGRRQRRMRPARLLQTL